MQPSEVRLHPSEKDAYAWLFSKATSHLFDRQLSDISTNIYIEISNGLGYGDIRAVCNDNNSPRPSEVRTSIHNPEPNTYNLEKQLQDSIYTIQKLETEIETYKHRERTLLSQNHHLRQAFIIYLRKVHIISRSLRETERQIHKFLNSIKVKKWNYQHVSMSIAVWYLSHYYHPIRYLRSREDNSLTQKVYRTLVTDIIEEENQHTTHNAPALKKSCPHYNRP